jgi:ribosomal protein S18 acetylase RimI-like enzyme
MRETLDAHDAELIEKVGFQEACRESLASLLEADPVACIRLATDPAGELVGLVSGRLMPTGRAFVLFVGVCRDHRGRGHGRELLAWQTRELVASGATVLIADTDNANVPMAGAFADVGWPQTETRIDLVLA